MLVKAELARKTSSIISKQKLTQSQPEKADFHQESNNQANMETINKLRQFGLSDEQTATSLNLLLEVVKQVNDE